MSVEQDLQTSLDNIQAAVVVVGNKIAAMTATIADLQAQVAAGGVVSQAQLDSLVTESQSIEASLAPLTVS